MRSVIKVPTGVGLDRRLGVGHLWGATEKTEVNARDSLADVSHLHVWRIGRAKVGIKEHPSHHAHMVSYMKGSQGFWSH